MEPTSFFHAGILGGYLQYAEHSLCGGACREAAFDSRLRQMGREFAACTPRHDPGNFFQSLRLTERKNGPIRNQFAFMQGQSPFFTC